ncbi:unnamed protein product [Rotaria socialis]|uniref:DSBA-like thioredoxin domain-containing protein n=1 Tax=Rotaria socialis TaxID=392032 RepID=A0A817R5F5_9BILA|nr:unnamed protein product [Rotaria socialis]CAF4629566.1 unnamed protein product [Rotaria socialis]
MFPIRFIRSYSTGRAREIIKFYYDFKSPFTYLALEPALQLEKDYPVQISFIPWRFRAEETFGGTVEQRDKRNWDKIRYGYSECRRFANERGLIIRGSQRIFDSSMSLIAGLYADKHQFFHAFASRTFELFFKRQLNIENMDEIIKLLYETSRKDKTFEEFSQDFQNYLNNQGQQDYLNAEIEAELDHVFGVPMFIIRDEPFWGYDRLSWVRKRLDSLHS